MLSVFDTELWLSAVVETEVTVGAVLSNVTLPLPLVTADPAFPAESLNAILYVTEPAVSLSAVVYAAVHVFPDVFTYVTDVSVIAAPPETKVTTGVDIVSLAVNVSVTYHQLLRVLMLNYLMLYLHYLMSVLFYQTLHFHLHLLLLFQHFRQNH